VKITTVCDSYQAGDHHAVIGPQSCDLVVGQRIIPNTLRPRSPDEEFVDVWQLADTLFITRGDGSNRVQQQFSIKSAEVIQ